MTRIELPAPVLRIADYRGQYMCKTGAFVEDFPLERALEELGL